MANTREWLEQRFDWDSCITAVDMFAGAGGLSFGLESVPGLGVVAAFERDSIACETHAANMAAPVHAGDVGKIESFPKVLKALRVRRVDILVGGPPCQGYSRLGKGALRRMALEDGRGVDLEDKRNWLFRHFMRAVRQLTPQVVVIENVPEMLAYDEIIEEVRGVFEELNYAFDLMVLKAQEHGVPQRRKRLFMVANRHGKEVVWPVACKREITLRDAISDLPVIAAGHSAEELAWHQPESLGSYLQDMRAGLEGEGLGLIREHVTRGHRPEDIEAFGHMQEGDRYSAVPKALRRYRDDIFLDKYHRMKWGDPAWTLTAHLAKDGYKYIHPGQNRTISVREAARLQSFPDRFRFAGSRTHRYTHIGNAVPPKLAAALGACLIPLVE